MTRCRTLVLGLLLVQSVFGQYDGNPYLNGYVNDYQAFANDQQQQQEQMDLSQNPFIQHAINNRAVDAYSAPQYLPPVEKQQLICSRNQICIKKNQCKGGYFTDISPESRQDCDYDTEVCCSYRPPPPTTPVPSTPCTGNNFACVSPNLCNNGVIAQNGFLKSQSQSSGKCYAPEVCCRIPEPESTALTDDGYVVRVPENPLPTPRPTARPSRPPSTFAPTYLPPLRGEEELSLPINPPSRGENVLNEILPPKKCAAALNCTEIQFCSATGVITKEPVFLTKEQEQFRVPLTDCRDVQKGIIGKCCRDPDYVDPWPVSQLGMYNAELFGDTGRYDPNSNRPARVARPEIRSSARPARTPSVLAASASFNIPVQRPKSTAQFAKPSSAQCATRNLNAPLRGSGPYDAAFSEYPWQAMILLESTKSLLCGGAIIGDEMVATAAHCVQGRKTFDVLIKGGEWKLGRDEEPLNFQLVRVKKIEIHPKYDPSTLDNDMAILHLDAKLKFDQHIGQICIDGSDPTPNDECFTTGWGKTALRLHAQDAVMHHSPVSIVQCYQDGNTVCAQPSIDACELDPGSALACTNGRGQYVLKGIYSTEDQCGNAVITFAKPDVQWINANKGKRGFAQPARLNFF